MFFRCAWRDELGEGVGDGDDYGLPKSPSVMPVARHRARARPYLRQVDVAERSERLL